MKRSLACLLAPACLAAALCAGCAFGPQATPAHPPVDVTLVPETAAPVPTPSPTPVPSPTPAPTPEPTPSPTPTPEPTPYKSADYPLPPKSLRTREGGRYPEEARLNEIPIIFTP